MLRYEILRPLSGSLDQYAVQDRWNHQELTLTLLDSPENALERETEIGRRVALSHPNVVPIVDVGWRGRHIGLITPRLKPIVSLPESIEQRLTLGYQLTNAVAALHKQGCFLGILSPQQVMLDPDGSLVVAYYVAPGAKERTRILSRKVRYGSPQFLKTRQPCKSSDLYSLGLTLYWILTGREAFHAGPDQVIRAKQDVGFPKKPRLVSPDIPGCVEAVILDLLEKTPNLRPSVARVLQVLSDAARSRPIAPSFSPPMIGREPLMSMLQRELQRSRRVKFRASHAFRGRSGIGKSTFLASVVRLAKLMRIEVLQISHADGDGPFECLKRLMRDPGSDPEDLVGALEELDEPLLIACDDVQWMDEGTARLLRRLVLFRKGATVLIATLRSDLQPGQWDLVQAQLGMSGIHQNHLIGPLTRPEIETLCSYAAQFRPAPSAEELRGVTSGVPFYACEFLKAGTTLRSHAFWTASSNTRVIPEVPTGIVQNVQERLAGLNKADRYFVQVLAVLDQPIVKSVLEELLPDSSTADLMTEDLRESDLIAPIRIDPDPDFQLAHDWIGWIIRQHLRQSFVRRVEASLLSVLQKSHTQEANWIARLCARVGDFNGGLTFLKQAVMEHAGNGFHRAAADLILEYPADLIVHLGPWPLVKQCVLSLRISGEYESAVELAKKYVSHGRASIEERTWLLLRIVSMETLLPQCRTKVEGTLRELFFSRPTPSLLESQVERAAAHFLVNLSSSRERVNKRKASQLFQVLEAGLTEAWVDDYVPQRQLINALCTYCRRSGLFRNSFRLVSRTLGQVSSPLSYATGCLSTAIDMVELDSPQSQVDRLIREGQRIAKDLGNVELLALSLALQASLLRRAGRHSDARLLAASIPEHGLRTYQSDFRKEVIAANECWALHPEAALRLVGKLPDEFLAWFDCRRIRNWSMFTLGKVQEALADSEENRSEPEAWKDDILAAHCYLWLGDTEESERKARRAANAIPEHLPSYQAQIRLLQAEIRLRLEEPEGMRLLAHRALSISKRHFLFPWMAIGYSLVGIAEARLGNQQKARANALRAEQAAKNTDRPQVHIQVNRALGEIACRAGRFAACRYR